MIELVNTKKLLFDEDENCFSYSIDNLLANSSTILFSAPSKVGKTVLTLELCKSILNNKKYLIFEKFKIDYIIYLSNDSTEYSIINKMKKLNFDNDSLTNFYLYCNKNSSVNELEEIFKSINRDEDENCLLIVDVLIGLNFNNLNINDYSNMTLLIDELELTIQKYSKKGSSILIHHYNKAGNVLGSTALKSRVSGYLNFTVDSSNNYGLLQLMSNDFDSYAIPIKRRKGKAFGWMLDKRGNYLENQDINFQLLKLNSCLNNCKTHEIKGDANSVISQSGIQVTPKTLRSWLKDNKNLLNDNNIYYQITKSYTTIFRIYIEIKK